MNLDRMGNAEAEIMKILWKNGGEAIKAPDICRELEDKFDWKRTTILTLIHRLVVKGFVKSEKKELLYYTPLVSEEEYQRNQTHNFINRVYDGNVKNLISALCRAKTLNKVDIEELQDYLAREAERNG